jgi:hypothetical protein
MAGIRGSQAYAVLAKQTVKGTPITVFTDKSYLSGGNLGPTRETDRLQETDNARDAGDSFVQQTAAGGAPEFYLRDSVAHHLLQAGFGSISTSGTTNYTHTITLAAALDYWTFGKMQGNLLFEQYEDCMVNELTVSGDAGNPLTIGLDVAGRKSVRVAAEWASPPTVASDAVYNFNDATVTLGGSGTALISSFNLTVSNNVSRQQTDDSVPYDVVPGLREVTLEFDMIFETLAEYNTFHYGSAVGTTQVATNQTTTANFAFAKGANNSVAFDFPKLTYDEFPVEPDVSGDPITVAVRAVAQRHASGFVSAVVKNQRAT